jgi:hypothetical protein
MSKRGSGPIVVLIGVQIAVLAGLFMDGGARLHNIECSTIWMTSFIPQASAYLRKVLSEGE